MTHVSLPTPALEALIRTYFHQDYDLIGSVEENVDRFVVDFPDLAPSLPTEAMRAIETLSDAEAGAMMGGFGCELLPPDGLTYREWLTQIAERVRAATT